MLRQRIRLLPMVVFATALVLTIKVEGLWSALTVSAGSQTSAETAARSKPDPVQPTATPEPAPAPGPALAPLAATEGETEGGTDAAPDPLSYTNEEVDLLQALSQRREQLDAREQALDQREALMAAAEKRVDEKVAELTKLRDTVSGLLAQHDEQEEAQFKSLVKIYETMKPADAARIFEQLEMDTLLGVVGRMKEQKTAAILGQMDPTKAKEITIQLAERRKLPTP